MATTPSSLRHGGTKLETEFIQGMGRQNDRLVIIVDIDQIFSADELTLVQTGRALQDENSVTE